jgi:hypothetical protein
MEVVEHAARAAQQGFERAANAGDRGDFGGVSGRLTGQGRRQGGRERFGVHGVFR